MTLTVVFLLTLSVFILIILALFYLSIRIRDIIKIIDSLNSKIPETEAVRLQASQAITNLNQQFGSLNQKAQEISVIRAEVVNLRNLFTVPFKAGMAGERILEAMLKDVLGTAFYSTQYSLSTGNVDFAITFKDCIVPVDSKLSLENFRKMLESNDPTAQKSFWKAFSSDVKKRIDETAKYILPGERTTDFAFMYVPSESVYYEAFVKDSQFAEPNTLAEYAHRKKVYPVSPQTIYPYLIVILQGLKALKIEENVKDVLDKISGLKNDANRFYDIYNIIIGHIQDAQKKHAQEGAPKLDTLRKNIDTLESKTKT